MLNYQALNDVEFEKLCKDVMEKKLSTPLRHFAPGRDGGIDLSDNALGNNILVQVKHYIGSSFSSLRTSLTQELPKVVEKNPTQYYVCCGKSLTPQNIQDLYTIFTDYMDSDNNIITLLEIDDFLQKEENADILRKHYKLWLHASGVLNQIYNQNVFIDCEVLFNRIEDDANRFVVTSAFNDCLRCLDQHRMLFILGHLGIGKTMTSKMLLLHYAEQGYTIRYTTNGSIGDIKRSMSQERTKKEIILLDDCLGQYYFSMKENQESELTALINYVEMYPDKKIILNSRITVLNEAKERSEGFNLFLESSKIKNYTINMDSINLLEKAEIFYNHLIANGVPSNYYADVKNNQNYFKIVAHPNYTPRIVEYATSKSHFEKVEPGEYAVMILGHLDNPNDIWKNEYAQRIQNVDRILLNTLFSLTDTSVESDTLKKSFNARLSSTSNIDLTQNHFDMALGRLNQSMVKVVDTRGENHIAPINPSINDFLKNTLLRNTPETEMIIDKATHFIQIQRLMDEATFTQYLHAKLLDGDILRLDFGTHENKSHHIMSYICMWNVESSRYDSFVMEYLKTSFERSSQKEELLTHNEILEKLLNSSLYEFYKVASFFDDEFIRDLCRYAIFDLSSFVKTVNIFTSFFKCNKNILHLGECEIGEYESTLVELLQESTHHHSEYRSISDFYSTYDIHKLVQENAKLPIYDFERDEYYEEDHDIDSIVNAISEMLIDDIYEEIVDLLGALDYHVSTDFSIIPDDFDVDYRELESVVQSHIRIEPDDDEHRRNSANDQTYKKEISLIFER